MRFQLRFVRLLAAALAAAALLAAPRGGAAQGKDEPDVTGALADQVAAWNRGDIEAFCAVYAEDAVFLSPSGVARGHQAVLERYRKKYPDRAAMGTLSLQPIETRTYGARAERSKVARGASVAARWTLRYPDRPEATGLTLIVLQDRGAGWEIVQDASM
jgi:uncharacterized protein (TIGR02246 family)